MAACGAKAAWYAVEPVFGTDKKTSLAFENTNIFDRFPTPPHEFAARLRLFNLCAKKWGL